MEKSTSSLVKTKYSCYKAMQYKAIHCSYFYFCLIYNCNRNPSQKSTNKSHYVQYIACSSVHVRNQQQYGFIGLFSSLFVMRLLLIVWFFVPTVSFIAIYSDWKNAFRQCFGLCLLKNLIRTFTSFDVLSIPSS